MAILMSLFEALRASRASILEKPISTNRATCGENVKSEQNTNLNCSDFDTDQTGHLFLCNGRVFQ